MTPITIEIKILTAKAGTNVKSLAKETEGLKSSVDRVTKSTDRNTTQTKNNEKRQDDLGTRLRRLRDIYTRVIESKADLNQVDVTRARSIKKEIDAVENQIKTNRKAAGENVSAFGRIKQSASSALGPAGLVGLTAIAGTSVVAMTRRAITVGREYEQQLADLQAITGIAGERQKYLSDQALQASINYGESASNIIEANKLVASQLAEKIDFGTDEGTRQLAELSEQAIVLQKAAGIDLPTAVKAITATINQFNLPISESVRLINAFAAGSKEGAAEVGVQIESFKVAGATAAGLNVSYQELIGSTQALAKNNIFGSEAGTVQRNMLLKLADGAKFAEEGIDGINIKQEGFAASLRRLQPIMNDTVALTRLFGAENVTGAQILIKNADSVEEMTKKVSSGNVAYEQAEVQLNTYDGAVARLAQVKNAQLIPAFQQSNGLMVASINLLSDLIENFGGGIGVINEFVGELMRMNEARGTFVNLADAVTDFILPLRIAKELLESTGIIDSKEKYEELFATIDAGTQTIKDQINFLGKSIDQLTLERSELEKGTETYDVYTRALAENIAKLQGSKGQFQAYIKTLQDQRSETEEGSFEYAELTEKIGQAEKALSLISDRITQVTSNQQKANQANADEAASTEVVTTKKNELAESYKNNKERIDELIGKTEEITQAEWAELEALTAQNKAITEQASKREELLKFFSETTHAPIEIPIDPVLPDDIDLSGFNLDAPLKSIQEIISQLNAEVNIYQQTSALIGDGSNDINFAIDRTKQAISELIANGYHPQGTEIQNLIGNLQSLEEEYQRISEIDYLANFSGEQVASTILGIQNINQGLGQQVDAIKARAAEDKAGAKSAAERASIEKRAQEEIAQAEKAAKEQRRAAIKQTISATISEAIIVQFAKVIKTIPFPFNIIAAPIAAAAVKVGMNKLVGLNKGGKVPGPSSERSDTVPAILTPEEFVVRKDSAKAAPNALPAMNKDPKLAQEVDRFVVSKGATRALAARAMVNASRSDTQFKGTQSFNNGGAVGATNTSVSKAVSNSVVKSVIEREIVKQERVSTVNSDNSDILRAIKSQTEEMKNMERKVNLDLVRFKEVYDEFLNNESKLERT